ncbi:MAG: GntR family transcriptional regulator [Lachnospiraceae bacterium]|jgi:DNA-binding GntR family transcriptional regulator|nr:GntR family transcriptional regulator [Lachnospiraceae bacterium]
MYKNVSLADQVYEVIEQKILNGDYPVGEVLSESRLTEELSVSRTPIREALARLQNERLVETTAMGTVVLGITYQDVMDMYEIKMRLEPGVCVMAVEKMDAESLQKLEEIVEQQEFFEMKHNLDRLRNLDTDFHDMIYICCKSPIYQSVLSPIHHKLLKYRKASLENTDRSLHSVEEHRAIFEAIKERDKDKAEKLMLEHIRHAYESIRKGA